MKKGQNKYWHIDWRTLVMNLHIKPEPNEKNSGR